MKRFLVISLIVFTNSICLSQPFSHQRLDSLFHAFEENNKFMGSIAVSQNGKLLYSKTIGYSDIENAKAANSRTRYRIGSISKMFTAVLVLKAIDENKLSFDEPLDKYFPEIEHANTITVSTLLNHKSGIHDFTNDKSYLSYNTQPKSEKEMIEIIAKGKSDFEPGSKVAYSNSNYILLSYVLEKIYKKSYGTILDSKIVRPLKLKNTYFGSNIRIDRNESYSYHYKKEWIKGTETDLSIPIGAGGVVSNAMDLTSFIEQLFAGRVISPHSLAVMKTMDIHRGIGIGTGMLSFTHFEKTSYGHNGAIDDFTSLLNFFPEEKLSIALISNGLNYPIDNVLLGALSCVFNKPFVMPSFKTVNVASAVLGLYPGEYASKQISLKIDITIKDAQLFGQVKGQPAFPLDATAQNVFKFEQAGLSLEFDADKKLMILKQGGQEFIFLKE